MATQKVCSTCSGTGKVIREVCSECRGKGTVKKVSKIKIKIPEGIDYNSISGLRLEARQKLDKQRPISVGQASRISGVSPADVAVLVVYLDKENRANRIQLDQEGERAKNV